MAAGIGSVFLQEELKRQHIFVNERIEELRYLCLFQLSLAVVSGS